MTYLRLIRGNGRRNLDELEPILRDRILALDEPVSRSDWKDVLRRSRRHGPLAGRGRALIVVAATFVLGMAAGSALWLGPLSSSLSQTRAAGQPISRSSEFNLGVSPGIALAAGSGHTPKTISLQTSVGAETLYVLRRGQGGFCYEWPGEARGCVVKGAALRVAWGKRRVVGTVSAADVSSVEIRFTDGTTAVPQISWVSAPISAGFFLYQIPAGKTVSAVVANDRGVAQGRAPWYGV